MKSEGLSFRDGAVAVDIKPKSYRTATGRERDKGSTYPGVESLTPASIYTVHAGFGDHRSKELQNRDR
jgi:hypothetical protein